MYTQDDWKNYTCTIQNCKKCISTVIVNLCYTNIYYIYMYMNIKMVIFYVFKQDEKLNK